MNENENTLKQKSKRKLLVERNRVLEESLHNNEELVENNKFTEKWKRIWPEDFKLYNDDR